MAHESLVKWQHDHTFGQDHKRPGETRTLWVIGITASVMVLEIVSGWRFGSMALLADGLHMGSHTAALLVTVFAYIYARRHAADTRFCFGTGKVNALGGFTGALLLIGFALLMAWASIERLFRPVTIAFDQAIAVAVLGLLVNAACAVILGTGDDHHHQHAAHDGGDHGAHHDHGHQHHDHNLRSAYLHVMADALTSVLAIAALLSGQFLGWWWLDPTMGLVGAALVARWSWGLLRDTIRVLLDHQAPESIRQQVVAAVEAVASSRLVDLHVWSIGPGLYAAEMCIETPSPVPPATYSEAIPATLGIVHTTVQVCASTTA